MGNRHKNRTRHRQPPSQRRGQGPSGPVWPTNPPPQQPGADVSDVFLLPDDNAKPTPPVDEGDRGAKSSYDESRRNATTHAMRCQTVFPTLIAELIEERIVAFTGDRHPRCRYEAWAITELARATVLVEVGDKRLLEDEVRIINRVGGSYWQVDAEERADALAERISRTPHRIARTLERTKQGTQLLLTNLNDLLDIIKLNKCLNSAQRSLLFDVLGVPLPLRDGNRRVPAADNGPALIDLIAKEIARHEANLVNTLNQRDRDDQQEALQSPSTYLDKTRKQLRSDHARAIKRLHWSEGVLARLRSGVPASTIVDPRTNRPINPDDHNPPTPKRPPAATAPPTSNPNPTPNPTPTSPAPAEPAEAEASTPAPKHYRFPAEWPAEIKEMLSVGAEAMDRFDAADRAAAAPPEPQSPR